MIRLLHDFKTNLGAGIRLALFRRCELDDFRISLDQFAFLLALNLLLGIGTDWWFKRPDPSFNIDALPIYALNMTCFFIAAYLTGLMARCNETLLRISVIVYAIGPLTILLNAVLLGDPSRHDTWSKEKWWLTYGWSIYFMAFLCRILYLATDRKKLTAAAGFILMLAAVLVPQRYFRGENRFWLAAETEQAEEKDEYADYRALDAETLLYRQPEILGKALAQLKPQRKKTSDIYFVGFAGFAQQDVFSKEVAYAQQLLDGRFGTAGRSITLVNHLRTLNDKPLATATNLAMTLKRIGKLMDTEEDVLLLYLTSHGSREHELTVSFWPLPLNDITPEKLNAMLDDAGIKWRVVIVSACYSGGFVKPLQGPRSVIATAAASDRTSFGCGNEFDFTYFGEAVFKDQLQRHYSLVTALQEADRAIGQREAKEKLTPSLPQLSVGDAIAAKLERLGDDMRQRQCVAAKAGNAQC